VLSLLLSLPVRMHIRSITLYALY